MKENNKNSVDDCCKGCLSGKPGQNPACQSKLLLKKEDLETISSTKTELYEN
jgi:hypothetical protein